MPGVHGPQCGCVHEIDLKGAQFLLPYINLEGIRGLNEQVQNSARTIFKSYEDRLDETKFCRSEEDDPELMIHIPFKSPCKISSLHLIGGDNGRSPASVKIYADQENLDFSTVHDTPCIQEVELVTDFHGAVEYPLKASAGRVRTTNDERSSRFTKRTQTLQTTKWPVNTEFRPQLWKKEIEKELGCVNDTTREGQTRF